MAKAYIPRLRRDARYSVELLLELLSPAESSSEAVVPSLCRSRIELIITATSLAAVTQQPAHIEHHTVQDHTLANNVFILTVARLFRERA